MFSPIEVLRAGADVQDEKSKVSLSLFFMEVVMTLFFPTKVLCNMWSYDFYDLTLSTV